MGDWCLLLFVLAGTCVSNIHSSSEKQLLNDLFLTYDNRALPVLNRSHAVHVKLAFYLDTIRDLDEKNQVLTLKGYFMLAWTDQFLVWNATQYDNIALTTVRLKDIWLPDIGIYNSINSFETILDSESNIGVPSNGNLALAPGKDFSILCEVSVWNYPFDTQACVMRVGPKFTHNSMQTITQLSDKMDFSFMRENSEWKIISSGIKCYVLRTSPMCVLNVTIQRRSEHFILHLVTPVILLSIMNPMTFLIPPLSGERLSFGMALFLSFSFFISSILDDLPVALNETCYFTLFVQCIFCLGGVQCCISCVITRLSFRSCDHQVPHWILRVLCISWDVSKRTQDRKNDDVKPCVTNDVRNDVIVEGRIKAFTWTEVMLKLDLVMFIVFNVLTFVTITTVLIMIVP
ncbi:neuronal acetylcholine receptor subunit alpha-7-like [Ylistrum balloti]|uniref:neuronal acetylcholine receptor subunit alpha-7-like n=1 Tax=Ylistrum balloti TaxID=509963 RepID=UPI002905E6BC|nr:neuronal acetylcholine receptor subunit alpha-7-like [Ylistrum balloti]